MGQRSDLSSPQVAWAADGFPIYGNRGPGGVLMMACGDSAAHATYCVDACGGYYGSDWGDDFLYRYFLLGEDSILTSNPYHQLGEEFFPFAPLCLLGCGSATVTGTDRSPTVGRSVSRRRDCHFADILFPSILKHLL